MNNNEAKNKNKVFKLITTTAAIAFIAGFFYFYKPLVNTLHNISINRYIHHKMYRLVFLELRGPLFFWLMFIITVVLLTLVTWILWRLVVAKFLNIKINIRRRRNKKLKTYIVVILCLIFLFFGLWTINSKWTSGEFTLASLLLNEAFLFFTLLAGWLLIKINWEKVFKIFKFIKVKYIVLVIDCMVILLLILNSVTFFYTKKANPTGPNVVLVVIDCLRTDHVSSYGYSRETTPNIDQIAEEGIVYENAYSTAPWTKPAVASLFTSLYPGRHGAASRFNILPGEIMTLAEVLKNNGYQTFFFNGGNPHVSDKFNFYQGFDHILESDRRAPVLINHFLSQVPLMQKNKFFAYLHFMDVHLPYHKHEYSFMYTRENKNYLLLPGYIKRLVVRTATANNALSQDDKDYLIALYDGQIKLVDNTIKSIMSILEEKEMIDNTVVIITADHGDEFWDHKNFEHGHTLYNELIHVPLIIACNKLQPGIVEQAVSLVDLYPTILDWAHIKPGASKIQGEILPGCSKEGVGGKTAEERSIFASGSLYNEEKFCLIKDRQKLIFNFFGEKRPLIGYKSREKFELFNLISDPTEQNNLHLKRSGVFSKLKKELEEFIKAAVISKGREISPDKDRKLKEKLKSLGYL